MHATRDARHDIDLQRSYDDRRTITWGIFHARVEAVQAATVADMLGEEGADYALRQALVDLASACESLASPMTAPAKPYDMARAA